MEIFHNLRLGDCDQTADQMLNPENHLNDENVRMVNIQRNDAEVALVFASMVMVVGVDSVPYDWVYYFVLSRICHTVAYVLHLPQPARALAWIPGVYFTCKVILLAI